MPSSELAPPCDTPAVGVACADARPDGHHQAPGPQPHQPAEEAVQKGGESGDDSDEESSEEESSDEESSDEDSDDESEAESANGETDEQDVHPTSEATSVQAPAAPGAEPAQVGEKQPAAEAATPAASTDEEADVAVGPEEVAEAAAMSPDGIEAALPSCSLEAGPTATAAVANVKAPDGCPREEQDASVDKAAPPANHANAMQPETPAEEEVSPQQQPGEVPTADAPAEARGIKSADPEVVPSASPDSEVQFSGTAGQEVCEETEPKGPVARSPAEADEAAVRDSSSQDKSSAAGSKKEIALEAADPPQTDVECAVTDDDADDEMEDLMKSSDGEQSEFCSAGAPREQTLAAQTSDASRKHLIAAAPGLAASNKPAQAGPVGLPGHKALLSQMQPRSSPVKSRPPPQQPATNAAKAVLAAVKPRAPRLPAGRAGHLPAIAQQTSTRNIQQRTRAGAAQPTTPALPKISPKLSVQQQQTDSDQHAIPKETSVSLLAYVSRPGIGQVRNLPPRAAAWGHIPLVGAACVVMKETHRLNGLAESKRAEQRRMQRVAEATRKTEEVNAESDALILNPFRSRPFGVHAQRAFKQWLHNKGMEQQLEKSRQRVLQKAAMMSSSLYWDDADEKQQREKGWMDNFGSSVNVSRMFQRPGAARLAGRMEPDGTKSEPDISARCVPKPRIIFNA
eukprot:366097-Chlamydomonas_euryale.AAC.16